MVAQNLSSAARKGNHDLDTLFHYLRRLAGCVGRHRTRRFDSRVDDSLDEAGRSGLTGRLNCVATSRFEREKVN